MAEPPALPRPYPYLRAGHLDAPVLPADLGTAVDLAAAELEESLRHGLDLVTVRAGSDEQIDERQLRVLTACESAGVPTVLWAQQPTDLDSPVAAVVSHVVTATPSLLDDVLGLVGPQRGVLLPEPVDARTELLAADDGAAASAARRRELLATASPRAVGERLLSLLGLPVTLPPLVTVLVMARGTDHLDVLEESLRRQVHPRLDPVLVLDPAHIEAARAATAHWQQAPRIVPAVPRATLADRLNIGIEHAHGDLVAIIEDTVRYGPYHLLDLAQALEHSGAHLVGKASWFIADPAGGPPVLTRPGKQRSFGHVPATGSMLMHRSTAQHYGFVRRASGINWPLAARLAEDGAASYSIHPYDMLAPARRGLPALPRPGPQDAAAFPFPEPSDLSTRSER